MTVLNLLAPSVCRISFPIDLTALGQALHADLRLSPFATEHQEQAANGNGSDTKP